MKEHFEAKRPMSKSEAAMLVTVIQQQEERRGRIDEERDQFTKILNDLDANAITPDEAVEKANSIADGRMDYN